MDELEGVQRGVSEVEAEPDGLADQRAETLDASPGDDMAAFVACKGITAIGGVAIDGSSGFVQDRGGERAVGRGAGGLCAERRGGGADVDL